MRWSDIYCYIIVGVLLFGEGVELFGISYNTRAFMRNGGQGHVVSMHIKKSYSIILNVHFIAYCM